MAREAPESVVAVASRTDMILQACDSSGFESFIATGLKYTRGDRARRRAFFTLEDRLAAQVLEQAAGALTFSRNERILKAYATALWGRPPVLRSAVAPPGGQLARRVNIAGGVRAYSALVPRRAEKRLAAVVSRLRRACDRPCGADADALSDWIAQAAADGAYRIGGGCAGRDLGDAIASPACAACGRLFMSPTPSGVITATTLLARLARALFDPDYADPDGFVNKGRALFAAELDRLDDISLSRRIGGLLDNDLGQMRVQFNARTYVVEPVYRDDGLGLWDFGDRAQPQDDVVELTVEAARIERRDQADNPDRRATKPSRRRMRSDARGKGHPMSAARFSRPIRSGIATPPPNGRTGRQSAPRRFG